MFYFEETDLIIRSFLQTLSLKALNKGNFELEGVKENDLVSDN